MCRRRRVSYRSVHASLRTHFLVVDHIHRWLATHSAHSTVHQRTKFPSAFTCRTLMYYACFASHHTLQLALVRTWDGRTFLCQLFRRLPHVSQRRLLVFFPHSTALRLRSTSNLGLASHSTAHSVRCRLPGNVARSSETSCRKFRRGPYR